MGSEIPKANKSWIFTGNSQMPVQELTRLTSADGVSPSVTPSSSFTSGLAMC